MGVTAEGTEHRDRLGFIVGFAEHLSVEPDNGVGSDKQLTGSELRRVGSCFRARYIIRNIAALKVGRIRFVGINGDSGKGEVEACKQFAATGRL